MLFWEFQVKFNVPSLTISQTIFFIKQNFKEGARFCASFVDPSWDTNTWVILQDYGAPLICNEQLVGFYEPSIIVPNVPALFKKLSTYSNWMKNVTNKGATIQNNIDVFLCSILFYLYSVL